MDIKKEIEICYAQEEDITFILENTYNLTENILLSTEVVGFYFGEPDIENNIKYRGKLKAEFKSIIEEQ